MLVDWQPLLDEAFRPGADARVTDLVSNLRSLYGEDWRAWPVVGCGATYTPGALQRWWTMKYAAYYVKDSIWRRMKCLYGRAGAARIGRHH